MAFKFAIYSKMRKVNKLIICLVAVMTLGVIMTGCGFGKQNIGVLDTHKLNDVPKLKQLSDQFKAKQQEFSDNIEKDKKAGMKEEELSKKYADRYKQLQDYNEEIQKQLEDAVRTAAEQVAKEKDLSVILNKMTVVSNGVDVTEDVVKKLQ